MNIHSQKFKDDFGAYFQDLEISTNDHIKFHKIRNNNLDFFKKVYPLYVLLESLSNFRYFIDPSKKILMYQYAKAGKKDHFVEAARTLFNNDPKSQVLRKGILEETFTPYYVELYSDGLMLLNQFYLNNYRGCYLMIRCILEDLYRHIYYKDHKEAGSTHLSSLEQQETIYLFQFHSTLLPLQSGSCCFSYYKSLFSLK